MTTPTIPAVDREITVQAPATRAFEVFTGSMTRWWPKGYHIGAVEPAEIALEAGVGGRWYEQAPDGTECDWGRVLAYDPPRRLLLAWHLDPQWRFEPDPAKASEIEVTFTAEGPSTTRVALVHRGFERHGPDGAEVQRQVGGEDGWGGILRRYAETTATG